MAGTSVLAQETVCSLDGRPIDKQSSAFIKAVDKLLTVGAYYSTDHAQYRTVSEEVCGQVVAAMGGDPTLAIEITAKGLMIRSQLIDPQHRHVRLLHDLLVPLNIARLEFRAGLAPADLRRAIDVLQTKRLDLGNTSGFQEIVIEGLPSTVSTAGRNVVQGEGGAEDGGGFSLEELLAPFGDRDDPAGGETSPSEGERLARQFLDIVNTILENLEASIREARRDGRNAETDATPENIKALREALKRLVEINPDPKDLARLIEHAKRALDLSHDPDSVDLVFSILKKESAEGDRWREQGKRNRAEAGCRLTVAELIRRTNELAAAGESGADPSATSTVDHLGICFYMLETDPSDSVEYAIVAALDRILSRPHVPEDTLRFCFSAMGTEAGRAPVETIDRLFPAFCEPLRRSRPEALARFWTRLWRFLPEDRRSAIWPHLVNDLMNGMAGAPRGAVSGLWRMAGSLSPKAVLKLVPRLEGLSGWLSGKIPSSLLAMPVEAVHPVHLAIMKSSLAPVGGPRLHHLLSRQAKNPLAQTVLGATGAYDPAFDPVYLALARQGDSSRLDARVRVVVSRTLTGILDGLASGSRRAEWVPEAIRWTGQLAPDEAGPLMTRIRDERRWFFFRAWPPAARAAAADVLARMGRDGNDQREAG